MHEQYTGVTVLLYRHFGAGEECCFECWKEEDLAENERFRL